MLHVALISPLFESVPPKLYGGTERVVYNLCRGLKNLGVHVTVFASGDSELEAKLIPIVDQALRLREPPLPDPWAYNFHMLAEVAKRAREFDVIHNHHDYWMLPLSEMISTPVVTTTHGRLDLPHVPSAFGNFPKNAFVSISDSQRKPVPGLNWVRTVYHGLDIENFKFSSTPGKYLAFLGRISPEKRPEWAIEIAKKCGIPLKIAAKIEGLESQNFFDTVIKPHVDGKFIEYIGEISENEKSEFLSNALALVFPIDWPEPFGLVTIEALACGTPVLARPCGSMPELLADGVTGYCHFDINELARRAHNIHNISRQQCREWVMERFSLNRMTEDYLDVYRQLAESQRVAGHRRDFLHSLERPFNGDYKTNPEG